MCRTIERINGDTFIIIQTEVLIDDDWYPEIPKEPSVIDGIEATASLKPLPGQRWIDYRMLPNERRAFVSFA